MVTQKVNPVQNILLSLTFLGKFLFSFSQDVSARFPSVFCLISSVLDDKLFRKFALFVDSRNLTKWSVVDRKTFKNKVFIQSTFGSVERVFRTGSWKKVREFAEPQNRFCNPVLQTFFGRIWEPRFLSSQDPWFISQKNQKIVFQTAK